MLWLASSNLLTERAMSTKAVNVDDDRMLISYQRMYVQVVNW